MSETQPLEEEQIRLAQLQADQLAERRLSLSPVGDAFGFVISNFTTLFRIGWPLLLGVLIVGLVVAPILGPTLGWVLSTAAYIGAAAIFAVAIHRWILLDAPPPAGFYFRFERAEMRFAAVMVIWTIAFGLLTGFVMVPIIASLGLTGSFALTLIVGVAAGLGVAWFAARLCLVFPHIAVTERFDLGLSWNAMHGKFWPAFFIFLLIGIGLFVLNILVSLPFMALDVISFSDLGGRIQSAAAARAPGVLLFIYQAVSIVLSGVAEAVGIAALSFMYREITQPRNAAGGSLSSSEPDKPVTLDSGSSTG